MIAGAAMRIRAGQAAGRALRFRSQWANFLAINLVAALLLFVPAVAAYEWIQHRDAYAELQQRLQHISASTSIILAEVVSQRDIERIQLIVASAIADYDVQGMAVFDQSGQLLDAFGSGWDQPGPLVRRTRITYAGRQSVIMVGSLAIAMSDSNIAATVTTRLVYGGALAVMLLLSAVLSALLAYRATAGRPLGLLLRSIRQADAEGLHEPVAWSSRDELGQVVAAYNHMLHTQAQHEHELQDAHAELERRVLDRTSELSATNAKLRQEMRERRRIEQRLEHLAHHDPLTDLPNRNVLEERLDVAIKRAGRNGDVVALLFLDLDNFKSVNDTLGHAFGDELLRQVAQRISRAMRVQDVLVRLGGDEFLMVAENLARAEDAELVAGKITACLKQPVTIDGVAIAVGASIGISICPRDATDPGELMRAADAAMYQAKKSGKKACTEPGVRRVPEGGDWARGKLQQVRS